MLDASHPRDEEKSRFLRSEEKELIMFALDEAFRETIDSIRVTDAQDGCMGSVKFESDRPQRQIFGSELARLWYTDSDGVPVSITLNADESGDFFEIDFWKVDFSPLIDYPRKDQLRKGDP